jgi:hypothetical protein
MTVTTEVEKGDAIADGIIGLVIFTAIVAAFAFAVGRSQGMEQDPQPREYWRARGLEKLNYWEKEALFPGSVPGIQERK